MKWHEMTWERLKEFAPDVPVVIPVAAVEQHGPHLPVYTDSFLLGEMTQRAVELGGLRDRVLLTPLQWLGNSHHHMDFPGTLSAEPRVYLDLLVGLMENVLSHGFRRILILNGHGGNDVPGKQAVFEMRQRHRARKDLLLLFATYWNLVGGEGEEQEGLEWGQREMGHACEWETSMMLVIRPDLVGKYQGLPGISNANHFSPGTRGWVTGERSDSGYIGEPGKASERKGEILLRRFASGLEEYLRMMVTWQVGTWD